MCDYSLHAVASRPAELGDTLAVTSFLAHPRTGFAGENSPPSPCACFRGPNSLSITL